jgi:hypothetical protein
MRWIILTLIFLFALGEGDGLTVPRDPVPARSMTPVPQKSGLLAARRRRYRKPAAPKAKPKHKPKAAPTPPANPADGTSDDEETPKPAPVQNAPAPDTLQRGGRVEFDGRLVQGQTAKSGAIYLFARQRSDLRSMVKERSDYRKEIIRTVRPEWGESP